MNVLIISASQRKSSESMKVSVLIKEVLEQNHNLLCEIIELAEINLPFWSDNDNPGSGSQEFKSLWTPISKSLKSAHAIVVVSPEWHGMVPPKLKNLFLMVGTGDELYHKPALIVSVSAGPGGTYPVSELRSSTYKNSRILYLPDHVIIRNVENFSKNPRASENSAIFDRLSTACAMLSIYAKALTEVREEIMNKGLKKHQNGL